MYVYTIQNNMQFTDVQLTSFLSLCVSFRSKTSIHKKRLKTFTLNSKSKYISKYIFKNNIFQ